MRKDSPYITPRNTFPYSPLTSSKLMVRNEMENEVEIGDMLGVVQFPVEPQSPFHSSFLFYLILQYSLVILVYLCWVLVE